MCSCVCTSPGQAVNNECEREEDRPDRASGAVGCALQVCQVWSCGLGLLFSSHSSQTSTCHDISAGLTQSSHLTSLS